MCFLIFQLIGLLVQCLLLFFLSYCAQLAVSRLVVMAADISPMDILTHIPLLAEESSCPYVFVTSKELLGQASSTKRPTSCVMVCPETKRKPRKPRTDKEGNVIPAKEPEEYKETYDEILKEIELLDSKIVY